MLEADMEILGSRILLHPGDLDRSLHFYEQTIGLAIYREWGTGPSRGVAFFLGGGGLLEVSGGSPSPLPGRPGWCCRCVTWMLLAHYSSSEASCRRGSLR
jgi:catechol 2,3-dioxygenase-like lactoylglutathione lyase family enzyme